LTDEPKSATAPANLFEPSPETFERGNWSARGTRQDSMDRRVLYLDGLPVRYLVDGAVLSPEALVIRFFGKDGHDRLLVVNLGSDLAMIRPMTGPGSSIHSPTRAGEFQRQVPHCLQPG
jgi:hypothetical protein